MLTSKTMEKSTKHTKAKHFSWNLHLYVLKKRVQFKLFQKLQLFSLGKLVQFKL